MNKKSNAHFNLLKLNYRFLSEIYPLELKKLGKISVSINKEVRSYLLNHAFGLNSHDDFCERTLNELICYMRDQKRVPCIYVTVKENKEIPIELFQKIGFVDFDRETWLVKNKDSDSLNDRDRNSKVSKVCTFQEFVPAARFFRDMAGVDEHFSEMLLSSWTSKPETDIAHLHYTYKDNNQILAIATLITYDVTAGLYNLVFDKNIELSKLLPEFVSSMENDIFERGVEKIFLQVDTGSEIDVILQKSGYMPLFIRQGYIFKDSEDSNNRISDGKEIP